MARSSGTTRASVAGKAAAAAAAAKAASGSEAAEPPAERKERRILSNVRFSTVVTRTASDVRSVDSTASIGESSDEDGSGDGRSYDDDAPTPNVGYMITAPSATHSVRHDANAEFLKKQTWSAILGALRSDGPPVAYIHGGRLRQQREVHESMALSFADALRTSKRDLSGAKLNLNGICFLGGWSEVLRAAMERRIRNLSLTDCGIQFQDMCVMGECMESTSHLVSLRLSDNPGLTAFTMERIVRAAEHHPSLNRVHLVRQGADITESLLDSLAKLQCERPGMQIGSGVCGRWLHSLIVMKSIRRHRIEDETRRRQRDILMAYTAGQFDVARQRFYDLKKEVTIPEQARILGLLPTLVDKYSFIGGFELMANMPKDFDKYKGTNPWTQFSPPALAHSSKEARVRHLLAVAKYKRGALERICSYVESAMHDLAGVSAKYLVPSVVDAFVKEYKLEDCFADVLGLSVTVAHSETSAPGDDMLTHTSSCRMAHVAGTYHHSGFYMGVPAFCKKGAPDVYLYRQRWANDPNHSHYWVFSTVLGGEDEYIARKPEEGGSVKSLFDGEDSFEWTVHGAQMYDAPTFDVFFFALTHRVVLKDKLAEFLTRRCSDANFARLLDLGSSLLRVDIGPPKLYVRAIQKSAPEQLKDLNRCTLRFDSPVMLNLAFHLIRLKVEQLQGTISCIKNIFLADSDFLGSGGALNMCSDAPPTVHMFIQIDGWTYEVMLTLEDVINAKEILHKMYDINRAHSVEDVLMPVFDPVEDFSTAIDDWAESY
eukprot:TRINITY_DN21233_c0_g6_i1.p1 TRINITY_DN21233_c0_g6~~TRINITY_DN21233_c0_g6_i1.p1  ORF type:complete len:771 (+),score=122.70 TRINITY_DN21233_c0_g6_i1:289-2601(+)